LDETDERYRKEGHMEQVAIAQKVIHVQCPICAAGAADFESELGTKTPSPEQRVSVTNKDRECSKFTTWRPGYTPNEHQDMLNSETLLKLQQEQRERDRRWQGDQRKSDRDWQIRQKRWDRVWSIILAFVAAILGFVLGKMK
jgi:hypothetical protein